MIKGNFIDNLPRVYGIYTGGFIGFIIIMAIAEQDAEGVEHHVSKATLRCFAEFLTNKS